MNYDDVAYAAGAGVKDLSPDARRRFDQIVSRSRLAVLEPGPNAGAPPPPPPRPAPRLEDFAAPLFALDGSFSDEAHDAYPRPRGPTFATYFKRTPMLQKYQQNTVLAAAGTRRRLSARATRGTRGHIERASASRAGERARDAEARAAALDEAFAASKDLN